MRAQVARFNLTSRSVLATICLSAGTGIGEITEVCDAAGKIQESPMGSTSRYEKKAGLGRLSGCRPVASTLAVCAVRGLICARPTEISSERFS
jgi:hypothetical protein